MVKCPRCGENNNDNTKYCINCSYPLSETNQPLRGENKGWNMGLSKKIVIVLGIVIIALLLFSIIHNATIPDQESSLNIVTANESNHESSYRPYQVVINYNGSWYGQVGDANNLQDVSGTGDETIRLDCASWDRVSVDIRKNDYSSRNIEVHLLKDGREVVANETTEPNGGVSLTDNM